MPLPASASWHAIHDAGLHCSLRNGCGCVHQPLAAPCEADAGDDVAISKLRNELGALGMVTPGSLGYCWLSLFSSRPEQSMKNPESHIRCDWGSNDPDLGHITKDAKVALIEAQPRQP